jgi:hypothetical protein
MIELLATGKPVVSTSAGTRGLARQLLRHVGVADEPERFARLIKDRLSSRSYSASQREDVIGEYGWDNVAWLIEDLREISGVR